MATSNDTSFRRSDGVQLARLAAHHLTVHDLEAAEAIATLAVSIVPDCYEARVALAATLAQRGEGPRAIAAYLRAIAQRPDAGDCWTALGELYLQSFEYRRAAAALKQALLLDRNGEHRWGRRARALIGDAVERLAGKGRT